MDTLNWQMLCINTAVQQVILWYTAHKSTVERRGRQSLEASSNAAVYSEFGRIPLRLFIISQILKYFYRIKLRSKNILLNEVYSNLPDNRNAFSVLIKQLTSIGVEVYEPSQRNNINTCVKKTVLSFKDKLLESIDSHIEINKKLDLYSELKESFDPEPYLSHVRIFQHRKAYSRLRNSSHNLLIETGRYNNTAWEKKNL